jgi:hypothetical protein
LLLKAVPRLAGAVFAGLVLAACLGLAGCRGGPPPGRVSGKVTFEGKAVREGRVTFLDSGTGAGGEALLTPEGTFTLPNPLPVGEYKVTVMPLVVRQKDDPRGPEVGVEKPAPDIPPKYRTIGSTLLKATVVEGPNEVPLDMKR